MDDHFTSKIPQPALDFLLQIGKELGFDPCSSENTEEFLSELADSFGGSDVTLEDWLRNQLSGRFRCVGDSPKWIQNPSWPLTKCGPMVFVGQIDIKPGLLHDDASFFVFTDVKTGEIKTIVQIA